jgi:hypothetical protein
MKIDFNTIEIIENKSIELSDKLLMLPNRIEARTQNVSKFYQTTIKVIKAYDLIGSKAMKIFEDLAKAYKELSLKPYKFARYSSFPWSFLWLYIWKLIAFKKGNLLLSHGLHFITALQGGGKSSLCYYLMEMKLDKTRKGSYTNADIERAYLDEESGYYVKHHKRFELSEFFGSDIQDDKKVLIQKKAFNTEHFNNIVLDELVNEFNHRMNNTSDYKEMFIPMMKSFTRSRHQRLECIWVTSVLDTTDIQLMQLFKFIHEVEVNLDIDYYQWLKDGMFTKHIKGWHIYTYAYKRNKKKGATEKQLLKKWYLEKELPMDRFDTLSQSVKFRDLKIDQVKTTKGVK